jgi:hypothetical protein
MSAETAEGGSGPSDGAGFPERKRGSGWRRRNCRSSRATRSANPHAPSQQSIFQIGVFFFGLFQDRDVSVGFPPEGEEIRISTLRSDFLSRQCERSAQLQAHYHSYRIAGNNASVIENLLKLHGGCRALVCSQIGLSTYINWIKSSEPPFQPAAGHAQFVRYGCLQQLESFRNVATIQCQARAKRRHITELY